ncbi:MAG: hypothetical protein P9M14_06160 [Candidatus Alcyoniella australis]|nr:hypothetical protein [Candidatus Alcyoniella australis]
MHADPDFSRRPLALDIALYLARLGLTLYLLRLAATAAFPHDGG